MRRGFVARAGAGLALAGVVLAFGVAARAAPERFHTVVIDPGHGGEDDGALGPTGLAEKDVVLDVAKRLAAKLRAHGLRVVLTRRSDRFVPLERRTEIANDARGNLFLSIHANAATDHAVRGVETYFLSLKASDESARELADRENQAFRKAGVPADSADDPLVSILGDLMVTQHLEESDEFARIVQRDLTPAKAPSRGVKQAPFVVLMGLQMPAALVEIGFITNPKEEARLRTTRLRSRIADELARAVLAFRRLYDAKRGLRPIHDAAGSGG